jgi:flagellin-like hook-associated protein FlgL
MRLRELATQAANGSFSVTQRRSLDDEADSLVNEYNRIVATTNFNGLNLLDGSMSRMRIQAGYGINGGVETALTDSFARNVGSESYTRVMTEVGVANGSSTTVTGDFNGDGNVDVITRSSLGGSMAFLQGNGDGTFSAGSTFSIAGSSAFYSTDFNNDGKLDLAVVAGSGNIAIAFGNGDGTFSGARVLNMGTGAFTSAAVGDVNGDSKVDLVSANGAGGIAIRLGDGDGSFGAVQSIGSGLTNTSGVALGDVNGDGALDILGSSNGGYLFLNSGGGTFTQGGALGFSTSNTITDINDDGYGDILNFSLSGVTAYTSNGDGTFGSGIFSSASLGGPPTLADLNGDGENDLIGSGAGVSIILYGNGDGSFRSGTNISYGISVSFPAIGDYDGDGANDVGVITVGGSYNFRTYVAATVRSGSMQSLNLNSRATALESLSVIDATLSRMSAELGNIGAAQRRLQSAANALGAERENGLAAEGRISNADVASESARLLRERILQDSSAAVIAQANQQSRLVLDLLSLNSLISL